MKYLFNNTEKKSRQVKLNVRTSFYEKFMKFRSIIKSIDIDKKDVNFYNH